MSDARGGCCFDLSLSGVYWPEAFLTGLEIMVVPLLQSWLYILRFDLFLVALQCVFLSACPVLA